MTALLPIFYIEIIGVALARLFSRLSGRRMGLVETLSLGCFLGSFASCMALFFLWKFGLLFEPSLLVLFPIIGAVFLVGDGLARCIGPSRSPASSSGDGHLSRLEKIILAGIAIQLVWVLFLTVRMPVSAHDALANYALKAKMFHMEKTIPEAFFGFPESTVAHPDYPPMLPLNMTWVYAFSGFNDTSVKLIMPFFYLAFLGLSFVQLSRMMKRKSALLVTFLLATVPQIGDYATIIHADLLLGALVGGAFGYLALYLSEGRKSDIVLSSFLMGAAFWAKNEAAVFAIALMVTLAVYISSERPEKRSNRISDMLISFGVMALVAWPWLALKSSEGLVNSDLAPSRLTATRLMENVRQIPIVLDFFQQEVFGPKKWNLVWITLLAAMVLRRKKLNEGVMRYLLMFFFLGLLGYFAAYMMITGNDNLYFYANTTISRFMIHFTGPAVFILALLAKEDIEEALK